MLFSVLCQEPHPKQVFHTVRSSASSFNFQNPLFFPGHTVAAYVFLIVSL